MTSFLSNFSRTNSSSPYLLRLSLHPLSPLLPRTFIPFPFPANPSQNKNTQKAHRQSLKPTHFRTLLKSGQQLLLTNLPIFIMVGYLSEPLNLIVADSFRAIRILLLFHFLQHILHFEIVEALAVILVEPLEELVDVGDHSFRHRGKGRRYKKYI